MAGVAGVAAAARSSATSFVISSVRPSISQQLVRDEGSFHQMVMRDVARAPQDKVAFKCALSGAQLKYGEIFPLTMRYASVLHHKFNVAAGDRVLLLCPNTPRYFCLFHACLALGAIVSPVNSLATPSEIARQAEISGAKVMVANSSMPQLGPLKEAMPNLRVCLDSAEADGIPEVPASALAPENEPDDTIVMPFSSGTTGLPKGVELTNRNLAANLLQTQEAIQLQETDVMLSVLPFFHIYGMIVKLHGVVHVGGTQVTFPKFDMESYLKTLEKEKATLAFVVPPIAVGFTKHPLVKTTKLDSVRLILSGAAPLGGQTQAAIEPIFRHAIVSQGYGLTETSPVISVTPFEHGHYGKAGTLVSDTDARIVRMDDNGHHHDVGFDQEGELWVRGPQVMKGYLNDAEPGIFVRESNGASWLRTGDIGMFDSSMNLQITDRIKELIKYKGSQVAPAELEAVLLQHPDVLEAIVVGVEVDDGCGEVPRAHVVLRGGVEPSKAMEKAVADFVKDKVSKTKQLRGGVAFVKEIPKSASGKLLRRLVRDEVREEMRHGVGAAAVEAH